MERARKSTYWLILPVLMIIALVLSLAAAPTQSRYTTVAGWQMTLSQAEEMLECDLLTAQEQKIRLQDMAVNTTRQIPLTLTAVGDAENVSITVESQYLAVELQWINGVDNTEIPQPTEIFDGETLICILTLATTEEAVQNITTHTEASAKVVLTWDGGTLQGEFLVLLLPSETLPEDSSETEGSTDETLDGTGETPDGVTDLTTNEGTENVLENGGNTEETGQIQGENVEIQTTAEDAGNDTPVDDMPTDDTPAEDTPAEDTPAEDTTPDEPVSPEVGTWLFGMTNFAADGVLPLLMEVPEGCEEIKLELVVGENHTGTFPAMTRYSTDGGNTYTLLYDPYVITITSAEGTQKASVLVDLSAVAPDKETVMTIQVYAIKEGQAFAVSSIPAQAILEIPAVELDMDPPVLTANRSIQFVMPIYGDSHTVTVIPLNDEQTEGLPSVSETDDGQVIISSDTGTAKPGTYLLTLTWSWNGLEIARQEFAFYVNYTPYITFS